MSKNLVIVESPAKARTIKNFLGKDYLVKSSIGHIRDMPKKNMGIDIKNNFSPSYEVSPDKKKIVSELKKLAKKSSNVYLATDEDREGEAIAWHLLETLKLPKNTPRIVFHEITKSAISKAIKNPRTINYDLVNAQQARRVIDRIVGFEVSPILWEKLGGIKSAGRVQSPVVRLVIERERKINKFKAKISFKVKADFMVNDDIVTAKLKHEFSTITEATAFANNIKNKSFFISSIKKSPVIRKPKPPFITSTLQQEAARLLGLTLHQTMDSAQRLYRDGHISYMRTDSTLLAQEALNSITDYVAKTYTKKYLNITQYKTKNTTAQEAHEAIRPTNFTVKPNLSAIDKKLYELIFKRTVASQLMPAKFEKTSLTISSDSYHFTAEGEVLIFDGYLKAYNYLMSDNKLLPNISLNDNANLAYLAIKENTSKPKSRYTESSLVKTIEELGIGRPSTFATMVTTVQKRGYIKKESREGVKKPYRLIELIDGEVKISNKEEIVNKEKDKLFPTSAAYMLTDFLHEHFTDIVDYNWTAKLENSFDTIARNNNSWQNIVNDFYQEFHNKVINVSNVPKESLNKGRVLGEVDGETVSVSLGRYGAFVRIDNKNQDNKPLSAKLKPNQNIETITLNEALELFKLPRVLAKESEFGIIKTNYGRFGPYIQYNDKYVSLKDATPEKVTLEHALSLIKAKEEFEKAKVIKEFDNSEIKILKGRFGPYISNGKKRGKGQKNVTIAKVFGDQQPKELTLKQCQNALQNKVKTIKNTIKKKR